MRTRLALSLLVAASALSACGVRLDIGDPPRAEVAPQPDAGSEPSGNACGGCPPGNSCGVRDGQPVCLPEWTASGALSIEEPAIDTAFGQAMAERSGRLLVGAWQEGTSVGSQVGAAYLYEKNDGRWLRGPRLQPAAPRARGRFGYAVAQGESFALVGEPGGETAPYGAVHVFRRTTSGWSDVEQLVDPTAPAGQFFGCGLALTDDLLVVGSGQGMHVYTRQGDQFAYQRTFFAGSRVCNVAASASLVAAAVLRDYAPTDAYAIRRTGATWGQPVSLKSDPYTDASSVAVDGSRVAVPSSGKVAVYDFTSSGEPTVENTPIAYAGAFDLRGDRLALGGKVYSRAKGWGEEPTNMFWLGKTGQFRCSAASHTAILRDAEVLFGAAGLGVPGCVAAASLGAALPNPSSAQVLSPDESTAYPSTKRFGEEVKLGDGVAVVRASFVATPNQDQAIYLKTGSEQPFFVFKRHDTGWQLAQTFVRPNYNGGFAVSGKTLAVGWGSGEVRAFEPDGNDTYRVASRIAATPTGTVSDVALEDRTMIVSIFENKGGALLVYSRSDDGAWLRTQRIELGEMQQAYGMELSKDLLVARFYTDALDTTVTRIFRRAGSTWSADGELPHSPNATVNRIDGDRIVRTVPGAFEVFTHGAAWERAASFPAGDNVGSMVRVENAFVLGYPNDATGRVRFVGIDGAALTEGLTLTSSAALGGAQFGGAISSAKDLLLVGAAGEATGRVHLYTRSAAPVK